MMRTLLLLTLLLCLTVNASATHKPVRWSVQACSLIVNCGKNALLTARVTAPEPRYTISWSTGQRSPVIQVGRNGRYIVTLKDHQGIIRARDTINLLLKKPFEASIRLHSGATVDTLVAYPQNGRLTRYTYQWYRNDTLVKKGSSPRYVAPLAGMYKVAVTGITGCRDVSDTLTYRVSAPLSVDYTYKTASCSEQELAFTPVVTTTDSIVSYLWNFGDQSQVSIPNPVHGFAPGSYTVSLTVTSLAGQTGTVSKEIVIPPVTPWEVSILQHPNACGDAVELQVVTSPQARYFEWNGLPDRDRITVTRSGRYVVQVYDSCTVLRGTATVDVTVQTAFVAEIRIIPGVNSGDTLVAAVAGGAAFPTGIPPAGYYFTWYLNGTPIGGPEPWITDLVSGQYTVLIETQSGCSSLSAPFGYISGTALRLKAGNIPSADSGKVSAFPNPSLGQFNLRFDKPLEKRVIIQVYDMQGRVMYTRTTQQQQQLIDISGLPKGQYFINIIGDGERKTLTLLLQ
ncbi:T9SS type A sorting domain-containing protein [Chitinophaga pinensis]|uniref:PKD domain containing protein n=1 Tax=Chitinophaga pinensis (strain ATCC 43595 / DSM 2588 / LMG 13176 / NBRC 15968 / NCIMB 11800 / UQM 2034) TaxID=485918 RepID=A0A979G9E3_CHIPD|nr:T9SS type A sorting domain-containing protein [Chitinophaga pinensis]ACU63102.1 PKD domain containing protein [Chitinophaga pinensis DSM 2588]